MNLAVSFLVVASEKRVVDALAKLLPREGRPVFADEVNPDWVDIYQQIEFLMPPATVVRYDEHLFVEWLETDFSESVYRYALEKAGAVVCLLHVIGDAASADEDSDEDEFDGYYYLRVNGALEALNSNNLELLLPGSALKWEDDVDQNLRQIVDYLVTKRSCL